MKYTLPGHQYLHNSIFDVFWNFELWSGVQSTYKYLPEYLNRIEQYLLITTKYTKRKKMYESN